LLETGAANAQGAHGKEYWRKIAANRYEVLEGGKAFALAKELSGNLKSSDPELRDDLAYSILATWVLEKDAFTADELLALEEEWRGNLKTGIGESGTDSIFGRSFSALCLSAIAERELKTPFLGEERYRKLLEAALNYLRDEKDLRGFDAEKRMDPRHSAYCGFASGTREAFVFHKAGSGSRAEGNLVEA